MKVIDIVKLRSYSTKHINENVAYADVCYRIKTQLFVLRYMRNYSRLYLEKRKKSVILD